MVSFFISLEALLAEISRISPEDKDNYLQLLAHSKEIYVRH